MLVAMTDWQRQFENLAIRPEPDQLRAAVLAARANKAEGRERMLGAMTWAAFSCPSATQAVYDLIAQTWLTPDAEVRTSLSDNWAEAPIPADFWSKFWEAVEGPTEGYDALTITQAIAALGGAVDDSFGSLAEQCANEHPGADDAAEKTIPGLLDLQALSECPAGSLGHELYRLLSANGFDPEVLDRNAIMLGALPPALQYLNTRILQMHDVWHLVAGYTTDSIHEVAISSFQLAQFGHNYSAMFLATAGQIAHRNNPAGFRAFFQVIAEAWQHGRTTPPMMAIEWEQQFDQPIGEIRDRFGIAPFESRLPPNLIESLSTGPVWRKWLPIWKVIRLHRWLQSSQRKLALQPAS